MRDPCWGIVKVKRGRSRAEVLRIAEEGNHIPVTIDATVAERCRLKGVRVVELSAKEEGSLVHQILRKDPTASPQRRA